MSNNIDEVVSGGKIKSFAGALEFAFKKIASLDFLIIFRVTVLLMIIVLVVFSWNVASSQTAVEKIVEHMVTESDEEKDDMDIRDRVSPKIQKKLSSMVYKLNCDRAFVIELHNGKKSATNLPFKYWDMTYEEVNDDKSTSNISQYFSNILITHYKLPYYLVDKTYFIGTIEELEKIDRRYASNFEEYGGKYIAITILRSGGEEIGFLGIAYNNLEDVETKDKILNEIDNNALKIRDLLDLEAQKSIDRKKSKHE